MVCGAGEVSFSGAAGTHQGQIRASWCLWQALQVIPVLLVRDGGVEGGPQPPLALGASGQEQRPVPRDAWA